VKAGLVVNLGIIAESLVDGGLVLECRLGGLDEIRRGSCEWQPDFVPHPSKLRMALDAKSVNKPFRKLGNLLKHLPDLPSPEDVHDVRTQTRRIEAVVGAFNLGSKKSGGCLLEDLKPIRKAAGDVRDMDVLTDFAASLDPEGDGNCRLKLMEHLAGRRRKAASKLLKRVSAKEKHARPLLKECSKVAEAGLDSANSRNAEEKDKARSRRKSVNSMASSLQIAQELRSWPKLDESNIHSFRLKVKELRYVLQLGPHSDSKLIDELGKVKNQIGLWHDWNELCGITAEVLDHGASCPIAAQIRERTRHELRKALDAANRMRAEYLSAGSNRSPKKRAVADLHPAVIKATSRLAS